MRYNGIIAEKSIEIRIMVLIGCAILAFIQVQRHQYFYIILLLFLVAAVFQKKEHIVSDAGVDIKYNLFFIKSTSRWKWSEIDVVQPDYLKDRPNVRLNFSKDVTIRSFLFSPEDAQGVMELAKQMNSNVYVDDFTEEDQEERRRKARERQEAAKKKKNQRRKK